MQQTHQQRHSESIFVLEGGADNLVETPNLDCSSIRAGKGPNKKEGREEREIEGHDDMHCPA